MTKRKPDRDELPEEFTEETVKAFLNDNGYVWADHRAKGGKIVIVEKLTDEVNTYSEWQQVIEAVEFAVWTWKAEHARSKFKVHKGGKIA